MTKRRWREGVWKCERWPGVLLRWVDERSESCFLQAYGNERAWGWVPVAEAIPLPAYTVQRRGYPHDPHPLRYEIHERES